MNEEPICPCEEFAHPKLIWNPPGLTSIAYRVGDYASFRHALLLSRPLETELRNWRPSGYGDLSLQLVEWWAYLADILTFYNERAISESYLGTAELPESVKRLIQILGYRPRPGIGASGIVAAVITGKAPVTLPKGLQIQSKPGPAKEPQIFELGEKTTVTKPDLVIADPPADPRLIKVNEAGDPTVLLKGTVSSIKTGDQLLVLNRTWRGKQDESDMHKVVTVKEVKPEKDNRGQNNTRVAFNETVNLKGGLKASNFRLLKSSQTAKTYQYITEHVIKFDHLHLDSLKRDIKVGDPLLLVNGANPSERKLLCVDNYVEVIWYANADTEQRPDLPPANPKTPGIATPHSRPAFNPEFTDSEASGWNTNRPYLEVHCGWRDVGDLIGTPATTFTASDKLLTAVTGAFQVGGSHKILIEDTDGRGVSGAGAGNSSTTFQLSEVSTFNKPLTPSLNLLFNLLAVSRGKTVANEILGSGDATNAGQEFVLKKSPLTYLLSGDSASGSGYDSTLRVWVNGIEWKEAPSFYGVKPDEQIFVTREDADNKTHVLFGDGINGARLPSGTNNVVAKYRYGSGADAPAAGQLSVIMQPQPNLKAIRNPVPVGGGADPDPPKQIRSYAPRSILTFGRAISGDDYETVAAQTPGVSRARAYWAFDAKEQRTVVTVYVGDDQSAADAASLVLAGVGDPNRHVVVKQATPIRMRLSVTLAIDPGYDQKKVISSVRDALLDEERGLFGDQTVRIGQVVYRSQIFAACLSAPGAVAVHGLLFMTEWKGDFVSQPGFRHDPGEGGFFQLSDADLDVSVEVSGVS